jgi:hypothetical protein
MIRPSRVAALDEGAALIIVLAFIVLLSAVVVAYLARSMADRPLAHSGFSESAADQLARSALVIIVSGFKQEIANGSTPPSPDANIVPKRSGNPANIPNMIRRSVRNDPVAAPAIPSDASSVNSTTDISANGRYVSGARWNKHYLIPRDPAVYGGAPTTIGTDPVPEFVAPDWVLVTNTGPTVLGAPNMSVLGRYAYMVYDEGGLLDINVAGFPSANSTDGTFAATIGRKGVIAFADLTAIGMSTTTTHADGTKDYGSIDNFVGWRNYLSASPAGSYATFSFPANPTAFVTSFLSRTADFISITIPASYPTTGAPPRIDQAFVTRSQLLELRRTLTASQDALQYLGTFSREINKPTWSASGAVLAGRFPLSRFDYFQSPATNNSTIQQFFGLQYVPAAPPTAEHWRYVGTAGASLQSAIPALTGTGQDPDLFRLLQYALPAASIDELLSIGASWIDQVDNNDETTWIEYAPTNPALPTQKAFGVDRNPSVEVGAPAPPSNALVLNRSFRNVGELGYGYRNASTSLDFSSSGSADAPLLDLFTYSVASLRAGTVSLNSQNVGVLDAILRGAIIRDTTSAGVTSPVFITQAAARSIASKIITDGTSGSTVKPVLSRAGIPQLITAAGSALGASEEEKEVVARAIAEVTQTRTWGFMIDVVAQSGRYPPTATGLADFVVEGEKRYWLHVAIDRFTGEVIDQQLEAVYE